jgi:DNA polymerase III epsilon subunit-like protein
VDEQALQQHLASNVHQSKKRHINSTANPKTSVKHNESSQNGKATMAPPTLPRHQPAVAKDSDHKTLSVKPGMDSRKTSGSNTSSSHACKYCSKYFVSKQALEQHLDSPRHKQAPGQTSLSHTPFLVTNWSATQTPSNTKATQSLDHLGVFSSQPYSCNGWTPSLPSTHGLKSNLNSPSLVPSSGQFTTAGDGNHVDSIQLLSERNGTEIETNHGRLKRETSRQVKAAMKPESRNKRGNTLLSSRIVTDLSRPAAIAWSVIKESRHQAALATLTLRCHTRDTLLLNKYFSERKIADSLIMEARTPLFAAYTPPRNPEIPKRGAVALDCEMVGVGSNGCQSELGRISVIDYLTGEVLIDRLVQPTRKVKDWRSRFSGITKKTMEKAVANGLALHGWPEARTELWKYVDADTIIVGQALNHDFEVLKMWHTRVVDSGILAKEVVDPNINRQWGLKTLCKEFLAVEIQNQGKKGHDSVEDAFAAREVVLWCNNNQTEFEDWGRKQREEAKEKLERKRTAGKQGQKKGLYSLMECGESSDLEDFWWGYTMEDWAWSSGYDQSD